MRILSVVGARPNFMKLAPLHRALRERCEASHVIVHTGQHYDRSMSDGFFDELGIPKPDHNLGVGSGTHARQTAGIMQRFEPVCVDTAPDLVLVYGDVNSTVAAALVAAKMGIRVGHVEAGLRSRDWSMPEEINRVITDRLSDLLFTPSADADDNLRNEGIADERIHRVGNIMIDSLHYALPRARALNAAAKHGIDGQPYTVVTLHRPSNVDDPTRLAELLDALAELAEGHPVLFPVHPRTRQRLAAVGRRRVVPQTLRLLEPIGYVEMLSLVSGAALVITDSGGLQEETTVLGVACLTVRPSTERPITISHGTNRLVGASRGELVESARAARSQRGAAREPIPLWDGRTAERIVEVVLSG